MKFNVNVTYEVEAKDIKQMKEVVDVLTRNHSFAGSTAKVTGFSTHKAYESLAETATAVRQEEGND